MQLVKRFGLKWLVKKTLQDFGFSILSGKLLDLITLQLHYQTQQFGTAKRICSMGSTIWTVIWRNSQKKGTIQLAFTKASQEFLSSQS